MKLWTDQDIADVELLVGKIEEKQKSEDGPLRQLIKMVGQAFAEIKHYKSRVTKLEDAVDKAILEIRIWSNCYGDPASKEVGKKVVEELRETLKGESK